MRLNQVCVAQRSNWVVRRHPRLQRAMSRFHARLYVRSGGRVLPRWLDGAPVMVLETVGRRALEGPARDRLWQRYVQMYPQAELYTGFTARKFPLVALEPP